MSKELIVVGGGEHARTIFESAEASGWTILGYIDREDRFDKQVSYLGQDVDIHRILLEHPEAKCVIGIGSIEVRKRIFDALALSDERWATIIHPAAVISSSAVLGSGSVVHPKAMVHTSAHIGNHAIINSGAIVEHDCKIGTFSHIAPSATLGGGCTIGDFTLVGIGSRIRDHLTVGDNAVVGTGAVVVADVHGGQTVAGVPAVSLDRQQAARLEVKSLCVPKTSSLRDVMALIAKNGTTLALVTNETQRLLGTITDGDIRRALLRGLDFCTPADQVMNPKPTTVR